MYLEEIRNRILLSVIAWSFCTIINYIYLDHLLYIIIRPCLYEYNNDFYFICTDISEPFYTNLKLIIYTSNQILYLMIYYHLITFIKPGLYNKEYKSIKYINTYGAILFVIYFEISYKLLIPWSFFFFFNHHKQHKIDFFFEAKMNEYIKMYIYIYKLSCVLSIMCMLLISFLIKSNADLKYLTKCYRKHFYILIVVTASIITPPEIISQLTISLVMIIIFEVVNYTVLIGIKLFKDMLYKNAYEY